MKGVSRKRQPTLEVEADSLWATLARSAESVVQLRQSLLNWARTRVLLVVAGRLQGWDNLLAGWRWLSRSDETESRDQVRGLGIQQRLLGRAHDVAGVHLDHVVVRGLKWLTDELAWNKMDWFESSRHWWESISGLLYHEWEDAPHKDTTTSRGMIRGITHS